MRLTRHQFGWTLAYPFGTLTAHKRAMVKEKPEQIQVLWTKLATEEKVIAQPGVKVFY
jgi:hypothetical protein